jgi:isoleucyl-tRNA synthetase
MSQFYLDIIKNRLYVTKPQSVERRAAQTTMYEILSCLVRILAPMTCFTAEEIWKYIPKGKEEKVESVMLTDYPEPNKKYEDESIRKKWSKIVDIKEIVSKKLEEARAQKIIGHSLNAKVILYAENDMFKFIKDNLELLKTVFIVSGLEINEEQRTNEVKLGVKIEQAEGEKCERCWMYSTTVGQDKENPTICHKCSEALK